MKLVKVEITGAKHGWIVQAHYELPNGKTKTETYACETQQSVAKRSSKLVPELQAE